MGVNEAVSVIDANRTKDQVESVSVYIIELIEKIHALISNGSCISAGELNLWFSSRIHTTRVLFVHYPWSLRLYRTHRPDFPRK